MSPTNRSLMSCRDVSASNTSIPSSFSPNGVIKRMSRIATNPPTQPTLFQSARCLMLDKDGVAARVVNDEWTEWRVVWVTWSLRDISCASCAAASSCPDMNRHQKRLQFVVISGWSSKWLSV